MISGEGRLYHDDSKGNHSEFHIKPNQGFLICPDVVCTYIADDVDPWEYSWIEFDGLLVKEMLNQAGLSVKYPIFNSSSRELSQSLEHELIHMANHGSDSPLSLMGHLYLTLDLIIRSSANKVTISSNKLADFYVTEAIAFIEQNFQNDISIEAIAKSCGLNRSYFGKIFRDHIKTSPQDFLIKYRMRKAAELLKMTKLLIRDISISVGYPNQLHFSRAFRNVYGKSPSQWRKENQIPLPLDNI